MLDEKGTVAALKAAYKSGGYRVAFTEDKILLRCLHWAIEIDALYIPPKALGTIVEHIGILPDRPGAYIAMKKFDPGTTCMLDNELSAWVTIHAMANAATTPIRRTGLQLDGCEIWQTGKGLRARPMDPAYTGIIEDEARGTARIRYDQDALGEEIFFKGFVGMVMIGTTALQNGGLERIEGFPWLGEGNGAES